MANTKISQLPSWTGTAADLRWFVMNNSGETETFKYSGYTSPFKSGDATNSIIPTYYPSSSATTSGTTFVENLRLLGKVIQINPTTPNTIGVAQNGSIVNGSNNTVTGSGRYLIFGNDNTATSSVGSAIGNLVWGTGNSAGGLGSWVIGAYNSMGNVERAFRWGNNGSATGLESFSWGEQVGVSGTRSFAMGAYTSSSGANSFTFGDNNTNTGTQTFNYGTLNNTSSSYSVAIGGYDNDITGAGTAQGIFVGNGCDITASGPYNSIINGDTQLIGGTSTRSTIVGGKTNTINSLDDVAMIGCSGRTASASATTYVENLHTYRTPSTQVQPVSSGTTFTCNLNLGAKSQFYITGTSTINITNVRDGASFMIKTQTDGNYVMTWTATGGYTFVFEGGIKDPGNNVTDIFVFEVFGSVIYGNRRHNYS